MSKRILMVLMALVGLAYLGVGWIAVVGLLALVSILQWYLRGVVKGAGRKAIAKLPDTITLARQHPAPWRQKDQVRAASSQLSALGFAPAGEYSIPEMPGVLVAGFANVKESLYAAVCEHPSGLVWTDISGEYANGNALTATNATAGGELDPMPGTVRIREAGASVQRLLERARTEGQPQPLRPVEPALFKLTFERAYARDTAARKKRKITNREADRFLEKKRSAEVDAERTPVGA